MHEAQLRTPACLWPVVVLVIAGMCARHAAARIPYSRHQDDMVRTAQSTTGDYFIVSTTIPRGVKQLALGLHGYHDLYEVFPPSITIDAGDYPDGPQKYRRNWVVSILPFIEEQNLYNQFNFAHPLNAVANAEPRSAELGIMLCPSDIGNETKFGKQPGHFQGTEWGRGNYGANACLGSCYWFPEPEASSDWALQVQACGGPEQPFWKGSTRWDLRFSRGVMGVGTALRIGEITDGTSHTILLAELRVGLSNYDRRGTWAMGAPGASSLWGHGAGPAAGPNSCRGDNIGSCDEIVDSVGIETVERECMGCGPLGDPSTNRATAHSRHSGGVLAAMADGSVRFINETMESGTLDPQNFRACSG